MVKSRIHREIEYEEGRKLDEEDKKHKTVVYQCKILDTMYRIALGKQRTDKSHLGMYYYPVYLLTQKNKAKSKIGVFEVEATRIHTILDEEQDVLVHKLGSPILFSHVNSEYLSKYGVKVVEKKDTKIDENQEEGNNPPENETNIENDIEDVEDDIFQVPQPKKSNEGPTYEEEQQNKMVKKEDLFGNDIKRVVETLPEEKQEDAERIRKSYTKNDRDSWITKTMQNPNYQIVSNEGKGDCLFLSLVQAFETIGRETTVEKLRQTLSQELTMGQFDIYRNLYKSLEQEAQELDIQLKKKKEEQIQLKKSSQTQGISRNQNNTILEKYKQVGKEIQQLEKEKEYNNINKKEFKFMETVLHGMEDGVYKNMSLLEKAKVFLTTSDYWADAWAISTLENVLEIKTIILTKTTDSTCIVKYTEGEVKQPKTYIMLNHDVDQSHYELVTYKAKGALTFQELPYDMKIMITKHCSQKDAGQFMDIHDFKQFKHDLGFHDEDDDDIQVEDNHEPIDDIYDDYASLRFHGRAADDMPGKSNGDKVKDSYKANAYFLPLETFIKENSERKQWRKMLDDSWTKAKFQVQDKEWASVEHYLLAIPFKDKDPQMYEKLSLSSNSDISSDLTKAKKAAKEKKSERKGKAMDKIQALDPDLEKQYRIEAIRAKFTQNADLTTLLVHTKMSKLMKLVQYGEPPEPDIELMKLRKEIQLTTEKQAS
jgi:predicted NAD-dependent protein-ADP-ribosyltransferase YbiA (DUF1768 family)